MSVLFLHQPPDVKQLFEVIGSEKNLLPLLVEKGYWLMHSLWGLKQQGFNFELKGGTSLSKGFGIIEYSVDLFYRCISNDMIPTSQQIAELDALEPVTFIGYPLFSARH